MFNVCILLKCFGLQFEFFNPDIGIKKHFSQVFPFGIGDEKNTMFTMPWFIGMCVSQFKCSNIF